MIDRRFKRILMVLTVILAVAPLALAVGGQEESDDEGPIELPFLIRNAGNDANSELKRYFVAEFNEEFAGQYEIVPEWMPGLAEDIRAKLKMLNTASDLPVFLDSDDMGSEPAFVDLLVANDRLMDLKPYFDASPEWQRVAIPESVEYNTLDGGMYSAPAATATYVGLFYNKEHFEAAGIDSFPTNWDQFWVACDKLSDAGFTPISLHTTETGWCPMLIATSSLATSAEGQAFMAQQYPTNYDIPLFVEAMNKLRRLFDYTTADAVGGNYALAANNFTSGATSMIPNGPWMIPSFGDPQFAPEGFEEKIGYAPYPDGVMNSWLGLSYGAAVSMDHELDVREGAVEFIKFLARPESIRESGVTRGEFSATVPLTEEDLAGLSPAMQEYAKAVSQIQRTMIVYQTRWDPITQNDVIPAELPRFVTDEITVEELVELMAAAGRKYQEESN